MTLFPMANPPEREAFPSITIKDNPVGAEGVKSLLALSWFQILAEPGLAELGRFARCSNSCP